MLTGKTAIVTGGTRGIGFAIVRKYLENGANVAIAGSRQETVEKAVAQLPEYRDRVMGIWPDLSDPEAVAAAFASVKERFGSLDILANNAGITLHINQIAGGNSHHILEASFKAVTRALSAAVAIDPRIADQLPTTKGAL